MKNDIDWFPLEVSDDYRASDCIDEEEAQRIEDELYSETEMREGQDVQVWRWKANDLLHAEIYRNEVGQAHRDEDKGPAETFYNKQGKPYWWKFRKNGVMHRVNGPAEIYYCPSREGHDYKTWLNEGVEHRGNNKPSSVFVSHDTGEIEIRFHVHGKLDRAGDLPAWIDYSQGVRTHCYFTNGYQHRPYDAAEIETDLRTGITKQSYWLWGNEYPGPPQKNHSIPTLDA